MVDSKILTILTRHLGEKVYAIYKSNDTVKVARGKLNTVDSGKLVMSDELSSGPLVLTLEGGGTIQTVAVYNTLNIDLLKARVVENMAVRLRDRAKMDLIIKSIKPMLGQKVSIVFKKMSDISIANGQLANMGMMELVVKPAPFFNSEEKLAYNSILNIYDVNLKDLISV